jgi:hypothetical protein
VSGDRFAGARAAEASVQACSRGLRVSLGDAADAALQGYARGAMFAMLERARDEHDARAWNLEIARQDRFGFSERAPTDAEDAHVEQAWRLYREARDRAQRTFARVAREGVDGIRDIKARMCERSRHLEERGLAERYEIALRRLRGARW